MAVALVFPPKSLPIAEMLKIMQLLFRITEETVGPGKTCIAWRPNGNTLAMASANKSVFLYDKKGAIIDVLDVTGNVIDMAWDKEGDILGIIVDASSLAILWNMNTRSAEQLETAMGARELPLCLVWSAMSPLLAIGNSNGNLFIYNQKMSRKIPVLGKHQRKITGVAMTKQDEILCCSDDSSITVSSPDGETIRTLNVSGEPNDLQVGEVKRPGGNVDVIVSAVLAKKTLFLSTLSDKPTEKLNADGESETSMNLQFQDKYGAIVAHVWYNDGYMIVGFEKGFVVCISAHPSEMGQEIFSVAEYKTYLAAVTASQSFGKILTLGDNQIKVREMRELSDLFVIMEVDTEKDLSQVECSADGQLVAVASRGGGVSVYLTKMPSMGAAYGNTMAVLSSLNQITYLTEGDKANYLVFFSLEEWCVVSEYRHTTAIRQICPDQEGLRVAIFDERAQSWVYSPVDDSMHKLPAVGSAIHYKAALWETFTIDRDTFVVYDNSNIYVYLLNRSPIEDESVVYIGTTKLPFAHAPLMLSKGIVYCLTSSGKTSGVLLESHRTDTILEGKTPAAICDLLKQSLQLKR
ncbi:WD domain G-beta repeat protein [Trichostrongylus colubriformis]|uniref:WD domain G-beta repeat protein n=1 Tax=Trichostrongylus colubriformis TaxID=6319 RepID=A0AAN8IQJ8_TRICO